MKTNWLFKQVVKRGMKKRLNDVLSGSYFGSSLNRDAMDFTQKIIRDEWDGDEKSIPHKAYCDCFYRKPNRTFYDWPCTCGMTALAHGQYWTALKKAIRFWIWKLKIGALQEQSLLETQDEPFSEALPNSFGARAFLRSVFQRHSAFHRLYFPLERDSYIQISFSDQKPNQTKESRSESNHGADQQRT